MVQNYLGKYTRERDWESRGKHELYFPQEIHGWQNIPKVTKGKQIDQMVTGQQVRNSIESLEQSKERSCCLNIVSGKQNIVRPHAMHPFSSSHIKFNNTSFTLWIINQK